VQQEFNKISYFKMVDGFASIQRTQRSVIHSAICFINFCLIVGFVESESRSEIFSKFNPLCVHQPEPFTRL